MCFTLDNVPTYKLKNGKLKVPRPKTAKGPIYVYKIVMRYSEWNDFFNKIIESTSLFTSLIQGFVYKLHTVYHAELDCQVHRPKRARKGELTVNAGFHSYDSIDKARTMFSSGNQHIIVECMIPAGAKYYHNPERNEYVSTEIKFTNRVIPSK